MLNTSFSPWPSFDEEEAAAVAAVLRSNRVNYWTGDETRRFEAEFAAWTGARQAIALANGTLALDLGLAALGLEPGAEVVVTPRTFFASAASIVNAGLVPVFADVEADSQNISARTIEPVLSPRTQAILCVHLAGWPCEMDAINALADRRALAVIEDCAQAHGARYRGRSVGTLSRLGAWSFCQDKIISTAGEGGMLTTDDTALFEKLWSLKDHGKSRAAVSRQDHPPGFRWLHEGFGTNARLTEMQSVVGRIQLGRMARWHAARRRNAEKILACAETLPGLRAPRPPEHLEHAWYKSYLFVEPEQLRPGWDRDRILQAVNACGVPCYAGSCPEVYREKAFDGHPSRPTAPLPVAQRLGETSLMLLVHPTLTDDEIDATCTALAEVMRSAAA